LAFGEGTLKPRGHSECDYEDICLRNRTEIARWPDSRSKLYRCTNGDLFWATNRCIVDDRSAGDGQSPASLPSRRRPRTPIRGRSDTSRRALYGPIPVLGSPRPGRDLGGSSVPSPFDREAEKDLWDVLRDSLSTRPLVACRWNRGGGGMSLC
jgi:hypothetical protein